MGKLLLFSKKASRKNDNIPNSVCKGYGSISTEEEESENVETHLGNIVVNYLQNYEWYQPKKTNRPSLKKAWIFFENVILPRRITSNRNRECFDLAPQGTEVESELYNPLTLPQRAFIEWGSGIDLYFISLKIFALMLYIAGLINIVAMKYYNSEEYNGSEAQENLPFLLQGSSVCTNTAWVVCESCNDEDFWLDKSRFATAIDGTKLVLRNLCSSAGTVSGVTNLISVIFLIVSFLFFYSYLSRREVEIDEAEVTATDYSIMVKNPPKGAKNPDEWRDFFNQFAIRNGYVKIVTIALNNDKLLRKLIQRRKILRKLHWKLPPETNLDDEDSIIEAIETVKEKEPFRKLLRKIDKIEDQIRALQSLKYDVTQVFVTFENEESQRNVFEKLTLSSFDLLTNKKQEYLFQGKTLDIEEPAEPDAIRWLDLPKGILQRMVGILLNLIFTVGLLVSTAYGITKARANIGPSLSGPLISICNILSPHFVRFMTTLESHPTAGSYQTSIYIKITLFRWMLTAILAKIIVPFTSTISADKMDLLPTIAQILVADIYIVPIVKILNIGGIIRMHVLGPRAKTQDEMNSYFLGTTFFLGERYADMTKVLFVVMFYSALFPGGFFFGAASLTIQYFIDKFSLTRIWGPEPKIGSNLAIFSRQYFFVAAFITLPIMSAFSWGQFPYDNVCPNSNTEVSFSRSYSGVKDLHGNFVDGNGKVFVYQDISVTYCNQAWSDTFGFSLPSLPSLIWKDDVGWIVKVEDSYNFMSQNELILTSLYAWIAAGIITFVVLIWCYSIFMNTVYLFFVKKFKPDGECQQIDFSSGKENFAYVPQVKVKSFGFKFLACNIDQINKDYIGWEDQDRSYDYYNLIFDVQSQEDISKSGGKGEKKNLSIASNQYDSVYSIIKQYPNPIKQDSIESKL